MNDASQHERDRDATVFSDTQAFGERADLVSGETTLLRILQPERSSGQTRIWLIVAVLGLAVATASSVALMQRDDLDRGTRVPAGPVAALDEGYTPVPRGTIASPLADLKPAERVRAMPIAEPPTSTKVMERSQSTRLVTLPGKRELATLTRPTEAASQQPETAPPASKAAQPDLAPAVGPADTPPAARAIVTGARRRSGAIVFADYPRSALRERAQGTVAVSYTVTTEGRASACSVLASSGRSDLDAATCRIIEQRFRYEPAQDSSGRSMPQTVARTFDWLLQQRR